MIRLQRIYNFLLFHAIILSVLDVMGFIMHFYIIFGTNLLTQSPVLVPVFPLFQCFEEKEYQMESKQDETLGSDLFGTNANQETWSGRQEAVEAATRVPLTAPPTYFFLLYIPIYPGNIRYGAKTLFPPPQPFVPVRSHLGAFSGAPPEGALIMLGVYINTIASPMMCE